MVVDGDKEKSLVLHRVLYAGNQLFDVLLAASADVAREIMRDVSVDVVITDMDLPGASGVDLVCWAAIEFPETVYVVHGEPDSARPLAAKVRTETGWCVVVPELGERVRVD